MKTRSKQPTRETEHPDLMIRAATVEVVTREDDPAGEPRQVVVRMSVSSDAPVLSTVYFNGEWQRCYEILDHAPSSIDTLRIADGLVIQDRHYGDQIGLMSAEIAGGKISGVVEFCSGDRAQEIMKDAVRKLRKNVSIGYQVDASSYVLEGDKDGIPVVRAMSWMPYEASFEPIPADITVGVNRADKQKLTPNAAEREEGNIMNPKEIAALFTRAAKYGIEAVKVEGIDMTSNASARSALDAMIVEKQEADAVSARAELVALKAAKPVVPDNVRAVVHLGGDEGTEKKIVRTYSVMNVLRRAAGLKVDCGFEDEINQECRNKGLGSTRGGQFIVPHAVLASRVLSVSGSSSATVATDHLADQYIDLLRTATVLGEAGVQFLPGLSGNIDIPKMTAGATGYWVAEGVDITASEPTLGQVSGTPHTCGARVDVTRRMLLQSSPAAEVFVRNEIVERIARTVQIAVFQGSGADGQPSAITNASGMNNPAVTAGTPTYGELLGFPGSIMSDNATVDGQKFIMTGEVWQKLAATFTDGTAKAEHVLDWATKTCLGFPYLITEDVGANSLFFGNWASVIVGVWGSGVDINMDTATLSSSGGLRIVALQDVDVMVRLGQSLAYNAAVTL